MSTSAMLYSSSTTMVCTFAALANAGCRESAEVDNSVNLYDDAIVTISGSIKPNTTSGDKCVYIYFYGSEDGTNYTDPATGSDAAILLYTPTNLQGPIVANVLSGTSFYFKKIIGSVAMMFGGVLPLKWGFVIQNASGAALSGTETNHIKTYRGIKESVV